MQQSKQVGILIISTGKYKQFVLPLLKSMDKNFLKRHNLVLYLYTDIIDETIEQVGRIIVKQTLIPSYGFPEATMLRYHIFTKGNYEECHYLFYIDCDMLIENEVGDEILNTITAVRHPGFYGGGGSWEDREISSCYVPFEKRNKYFAGGFSGGEATTYFALMHTMKLMIQSDLDKGIIPVWHDESAWNCVLANFVGFTELPPSHCMVEQQHLREQWGISHFEPKIVALAKNHSEIRKGKYTQNKCN